MVSEHHREVIVFDYLTAYPTMKATADAHGVGVASVQRWLNEYRTKEKINGNAKKDRARVLPGWAPRRYLPR